MQSEIPQTRAAYAAARDALLQEIHRGLEGDPRFVATWLEGSYGRGEQDDVSDIDLTVVVDDNAAPELCQRLAMTGSGTIPSRLAVVEAFGEPANIHENNNNAPEGGAFLAVLYQAPPVIVDWLFVPASIAVRYPATRLLFDRVGFSLADAPRLNPENRAAQISERAAFFWMMAAVTAKYILRGSAAPVQNLLYSLAGVVDQIEELLELETTFSNDDLYATIPEQAGRLRALCERVEAAGVPAGPRGQVETLLRLAE